MINQENHRKSGYAIEPEEEQLRYLAYVCGVFFIGGGGWYCFEVFLSMSLVGIHLLLSHIIFSLNDLNFFFLEI